MILLPYLTLSLSFFLFLYHFCFVATGIGDGTAEDGKIWDVFREWRHHSILHAAPRFNSARTNNAAMPLRLVSQKRADQDGATTSNQQI